MAQHPSTVFRLEAINPAAREWSVMFAGPVWVCAKDDRKAHKKIARYAVTLRPMTSGQSREWPLWSDHGATK